MFDHIEVSLFTGKGTPNLSYLTDTGNVWQGWQQYRLEGVCPLRVQYKAQLRELKISGSLPYLMRGHNYPAGTSDLRESLEYVSDVVGLNAYSGTVEVFEYGQFVNVPLRVNVMLANHTHLPGFVARGHLNQASKYFDSSALRVKLYDAKRNFSQKVKGVAKQALEEELGFRVGEHCLKVENHYKKPEMYFKCRVLVADLFDHAFVDNCKTDLLTTYRSIHKTPAYFMPNNKKDLTASILPLIVLKDLESQYGFSAEDLLNQKLKSIPSEVLTVDDRKARKRQIKKMLDTVNCPVSSSPFDVSKQLEEVLGVGV